MFKEAHRNKIYISDSKTIRRNEVSQSHGVAEIVQASNNIKIK